MLVLAVSSLGLALISGGAAVVGALVGGAVTGGTTLISEKQRRKHDDEVRARERYAQARIGARLVVGEIIDHLASIGVELERTTGKHRAWKFPTEQWRENRAALFDAVEHSGWLNLVEAYGSLELCEEALAIVSNADDSSGSLESIEATLESADAELSEGAEERLKRILTSTQQSLVRARRILVPITKIGLEGEAPPEDLLRASAEAAESKD